PSRARRSSNRPLAGGVECTGAGRQIGAEIPDQAFETSRGCGPGATMRWTVEGMFLSALHADPNDEVTWLALADWLEEDGRPDRAELVRLVRRLRTVPVMERTAERAS